MLETTPRPQDTTAPAPVELPLLSRAGFARLVAILEGQHPDELPRLRRGLDVLATKRIIETAETGVYLVESSYPGQFYRANTARCTCPDALGRQARCKHVWAVTILVAASVAARFEALTAVDASIPYELTSQGLAATREPVGAA